jgi:hypothetical protein
MGLAAPLAIVLYFKIYLAPPSYFLGADAAPSCILPATTTPPLQQIFHVSRHVAILSHFGEQLIDFGGWRLGSVHVGIMPLLLVYYLAFRAPIARQLRWAHFAVLTLLTIQLLGYYAAYLITPLDLAWQLPLTGMRLLLQIFPLMLFLILCGGTTVESVLSSTISQPQGARHATGD